MDNRPELRSLTGLRGVAALWVLWYHACDAALTPQFGFGGGAHHCLGHFVGRMDMSVALPILARRMPDLRIGPGAEWMPLSGNTGAHRLPLLFTPQP